MKDTLTYIISSIVDDAEKVRIEETDVNGIVELRILVAKDDIGKVIGKDGKIIRAIRNVMKIPAMKHNKKVQISVDEFTE